MFLMVCFWWKVNMFTPAWPVRFVYPTPPQGKMIDVDHSRYRVSTMTWSFTTPNLLSIFCKSNRRAKPEKKLIKILTTKKQKVPNKKAAILFLLDWLQPVASKFCPGRGCMINLDLGRVCGSLLTTKNKQTIGFLCGEIAWSTRTPGIYRIFLRFFFLNGLCQWFN